jgi:hypothetical protein
MKKIRLETVSQASFIGMLLIFMILCAAIAFIGQTPDELNYISSEPDYINDLNVQRYAVKNYAGIKRVYNFVPKDDLSGGTSLCIHLRHQFASVYASGKLIATVQETEGFDIGRDPGNRWLTVPLTKDLSGKLMRVEIISYYSGYKEPEMLITHRDQLITMILDKELPVGIMCILAIIEGLILLMEGIVLPLKGNRTNIISIGLLSMELGIWKLCGLQISQILLYKDAKNLYYIGIMSAFMLPGCAMALLSSVMKKRAEKAVLHVCIILSQIFTLGVFLLQLLGKLEIHDIIPVYLGECIFMIAVAVIYMFWSGERRLLLLPFAAACIADIAVFHVSGSTVNAVFLLIWMLAFSMISFSRYIIQSIKRDEELRETRITALMSQIRPHFVHNTLTSVYYLCETDPPLAQQVLLNFTRYLQGNFSSISKKEPVPFSEEIEQTRAYFAVEQARFPGELDISYELDFTAFKLPPLTLQPIVENSVKHGLGKGSDHISIHVKSEQLGGSARITIDDDGPGFREVDDGRIHTGIQNVRDRLQLMSRGSLEIKNRPEGGTRVIISVPV